MANPSKCEFGASSQSFLGHVIDKNRIHPLPEKVKSIMDYPAPMSLRKLREFLCLINFYRRFLPHCAEIAQPLVDRYSRWPEEFPLPDISAEKIAKTLTSRWVSRFGTPEIITTDRGPQFDSYLFTELTCLLGCKHIRTTVYHPTANGMVEWFPRQLKAALKAYPTSTNWME